MKRILMTFFLVIGGGAAAATSFDNLFPGVRVITRTGDFQAGQAYGAYQYRLTDSLFDVSYQLGLTTHEVARVKTVSFSVQPGGPEVSALATAPRRITEQLFAVVAQRCFGLRSERVAALQNWVRSTASGGGQANSGAQFGPVKITFKRTQSSGAGYYDLSYTVWRDGNPGSAPWVSYCTFF